VESTLPIVERMKDVFSPMTRYSKILLEQVAPSH
jgi:hypothetical protein